MLQYKPLLAALLNACGILPLMHCLNITAEEQQRRTCLTYCTTERQEQGKVTVEPLRVKCGKAG